MNTRIHYTKYLTYISKLLLVGVIGFVIYAYMDNVYGQSDDLLDKVYRTSQDFSYTSDADADDLFESGWDLIAGAPTQPIYVRLGLFLLRIAVLLGIPMLLFVAIKIITGFGDPGKLKENLKQIGYVAGGIFLALMSIAIIYLIISVTRTNLGNI